MKYLIVKLRRFGAAAGAALLAAGFACGCGDEKQVEREQAKRQAGLELLDQGDYAGAVDAFNKALQERVGIVSNLEEDLNFYKAHAQMEAGSVKDAIATYTAIIDYDSKNADAYYLRGCAYISAGQSKEAAADFKHAADNNKKNGQMYAGIYEQLVMAGLLDDAAAYLEEGLKIKGDGADACLSRGRLYYVSGDYEKAAEELNAALEKKAAAANLYLGRVYQAQGQNEEARSYYEAYLEENPNDSNVLYELGQISFKEENYEQAVSWFEEGMACKNVINKRELWAGKIACLEYMGNFEAAKQEMQAYLESYPNDGAAQREYVFLKTR
ncbi:MAG: tetratricopeptide repeat protein [Eubacterium sp.]|nr:tetratricopeptide repeat protein [Eubacterium sp.]